MRNVSKSGFLAHLSPIFSDLEYPIVPNEIFCRCTIDGCDEELVHIGGEPVRGMCRARGGMCRQAVKMDSKGHVEHAVIE